jgi:hypothetical protein
VFKNVDTLILGGEHRDALACFCRRRKVEVRQHIAFGIILSIDQDGEESMIPNGHVVFIFCLVAGRDDDLL